MKLQGFPFKMKDAVARAGILFQGDQRNRLYNYDRMILFATIWSLKVEIYVSSGTPFNSFLKHFTADLHEGSSFLTKSVSEGEILNLLSRLAEFLDQSNDLGKNMFEGLLDKLLVQIRLLKAQVLLLELMKTDEVRLNLHLKKEIGTLREGLIFLSKSDICQKYGNTEEEKKIMEKFKGLAKKVESLSKSNPDINTVQGMLSDDVQPLKNKLKKLYVDLIPRLSSPKTIGLGCIEAVLQKMEQLQSVELECHDSVACAIYQIEAVHKDLESMVPWYSNKLVVTDEQTENLEKVERISSELVDAVYQVEHVIDSIVLGLDPLWKLLLWLYHLSEEIEQLKFQIRDCESCGNQKLVIPRTQIVYDPFTERLNTTKARYQNLPTDLKQCLLYFGAFPRDEDVSVRTLLWLWIAERFIPQSSSECLEDVAEQYLMNLISRSLVVAVKRGSNGKVKTCRVDAQVLELCLSEGYGAKFLRRVAGETYSSTAPAFLNYEDYRLSIQGDPRKFIRSKPSGSSVRSLLFFVSNEMYAGCHNDLAFIIDKMKLLKVLNLESLNIGNTLKNGVGLLICLRYMAIGGDIDSLPPSLSKLKDLETFVVKGLKNHFFLPSTIWSMTRLRHIRVTDCIFTLELQNDHEKESDFLKLDGLKSLSMPCFQCGEKTNDILARVPNLQKLKCILLQPRLGEVEWFPEFGCLHHLESLKICYSGRPLNNVEWSLPLNLKELTLSNFRLPWDQISAISKLPNLEVLKLLSEAFAGTTWKMEQGEFEKLRYLKLSSLNLVHWYADEDCLPNLEKLALQKCKQLEELPTGFGIIIPLESIQVHQCGVFVENWARGIVEIAHDYYNLDMVGHFS